MSGKSYASPASVCSGRLAWLARQAKELGRDRAAARAAGCWTAVATLQREIHALRDARDAELLRQVEIAAAAAPTAAETPDQARRRWLDAARSMDRDALDEVVVDVWGPAVNHDIVVAQEAVTIVHPRGDVYMRRRPL